MKTFEGKLINKISGVEHTVTLHHGMMSRNKLTIHYDGRSGYGQVNRSGSFESIREDISDFIRDNKEEIMRFFNK